MRADASIREPVGRRDRLADAHADRHDRRTTPTPEPSTAPGGLVPGSVAVTVSDRLLVRSKPRVSDDSIMYEPVLPIGSELLVLGGPVVASGYTWFHVAPTSVTLNGGVTDGWVAMAARDGTPWIALSDAPLPGSSSPKSDVARAPASPTSAKQAAASINAFGLDLYRRLLGDSIGADENAVFSPTSIALALAMARAGARGQTASQMDAVLHTSGWDALAAGLNSLDQSLASRNATWKDEEGKTHALALKVANEAFAQRGWPIEQAYLDAIAKAFGSGIGLVDYVSARRGRSEDDQRLGQPADREADPRAPLSPGPDRPHPARPRQCHLHEGELGARVRTRRHQVEGRSPGSTGPRSRSRR